MVPWMAPLSSGGAKRPTAVFKITFYVPVAHKEAVKDAMFGAGAGRVGLYDRCSFESLGTGQYRPLGGSSPHQGEEGRTETVEEARVEMVCADGGLLPGVVGAMKAAHPYETVAYDVVRTEDA